MNPSDNSNRSEQAALAPAAAPARFGNTLLGGALWMMAARWAMRLVGLVSTMVLARLLMPEDFGLIAMVMMTYGLVETISYAGVDLALMRPGADTRAHFDTAWSIQILQGLFIAVCLLLAAPHVAGYFKEPRAADVMMWVAVKPVIDAFQNIGVVAFRKELDFAKEFRFTLYNKLLNFVVLVSLAYTLRNFWALVLGSIVASMVSLVVSYVMHPYRPRWSMARASEIWGFSQWLMISRIGSYLNRKCDEFVVGGYAGATAMGNYHVANELATLPSSEIVMPVRRAMFPALSKIADQRDAFAAAVLSSFSSVAALCLFVSFCLLVTSPEVVAIVLGSKWGDAVPLMRWMVLFGGFSALVLVLEVPLWVAGRTNSSAAQAWLELAVVVPVTLVAVRGWGVEGAAAARAGIAALMVPLMMGLTARLGQVSMRQLAGALWRPLLAALAMAALVHVLTRDLDWPVLLGLALKLILCGLLYPLVLALLWLLSGQPTGVESTVKGHILHRLAARRAARHRT